jgi:DNA-binding CsgD family transcriptional regulator
MTASKQLPDAMAKLTSGQMDVLHRVAQHKSSKEIARELNISRHTVDQRVRRIQSLLGASNRWEAARLFLSSGYSQFEDATDMCDGLIYQPSQLPPDKRSTQEEASLNEWNPESVSTPKSLHQTQAAYFAESVEEGTERAWSSVLLTADRRNALGPIARMLAIVLIMLVSILALAALISLAEGVSRIL